MQSDSIFRARGLLLLAVVFCLNACSESSKQSSASAPIVAGLADVGLDARVRGLVLLGELGCVNCHAESREHPLIDARRGPDLAAVGSRVFADYLPRFLSDPCGTEPGTTMPEMLGDRSDRARADAADALAHYLRSFDTRAITIEAPEPEASARGRKLFQQVGCVACHSPRDNSGNELPLPGSAPLGDLKPKYSLKSLRAFLLAPLDVRRSARMPDLHLTPTEANDLCSFLLADAASSAQRKVNTPPVDSAKVSAGRALFAERGCVHCHTLGDSARAPSRNATPLLKLDPKRGCLGEKQGNWPHYSLTDEQQADIAAALRSFDEPLSDEQQIAQRMAARNCTACHPRGERGGPAADRSQYFTTNEWSLGQDGRLPPPLTGVGAKLQRDWLIDAVAHGQSIRPYLRTRMPGFGVGVANELADLFGRSDSLPPIELGSLPEDHEQGEPVRNLGCELVGDKGMNCITCHVFAGDRVGTMAAIDLIDSTSQRLRREWFTHYLRDPVKFRAGTLMPQFFIDGVSTRPNLGEGNAARQIDAIWYYLSEGRNVRQPSGMRHPPMPLVVANEAVMLRRSIQHTGKRGISVGYPGGVNLTFDAESLGLNQIWWGEFVETSGVWTGQGSGEAHILGHDLATLPKGPAFVVLPDPAAAWPEASRRALGQRFLGYDLDEKQRPSFRYVCADVTITDAPVEMQVEGSARPTLRRTLSFASATDKTLQFRAARDARIDDLGEGRVRIGRSLQMMLPPASYRIRAAGQERELLVEVQVRQGSAQLSIDYRWLEESK